MKFLFFIAIFILTLNLYSAERLPVFVRETPSSVICRDMDGLEQEIPKKPKRVVICYTSLVGPWYLAGGTALATVSTSSRETLPEAAKGIQTVGGFGNPDVERIMELQPDLVILSGRVDKQRALREILIGKNIKTLLLNYENYNDFAFMLDAFIRINAADPNIIKEAERVRSDCISIIRKAETLKSPRPRFVSFFASARDAAGESNVSNTACIASSLGAVNIIPESKVPKGGNSIKYSMERLLIENPDIILFTTMGDSKEIQERMKRDFMSDPAWQNLKAVKENKVYFLPNALFLYRANARFPEAFRYMAEILYPNESWK